MNLAETRKYRVSKGKETMGLSMSLTLSMSNAVLYSLDSYSTIILIEICIGNCLESRFVDQFSLNTFDVRSEKLTPNANS